MQRFRRTVENVQPAATVEHGVYSEARIHLEELVRILEPRRHPTPEAFRLAKVLLSVERPDWVERIEYQLGYDATEDPAVWVWVIVADGFVDEPQHLSLISEFRRTLAMLSNGSQYHVYVRFRTVSEQHQVAAGKAK